MAGSQHIRNTAPDKFWKVDEGQEAIDAFVYLFMKGKPTPEQEAWLAREYAILLGKTTIMKLNGTNKDWTLATDMVRRFFEKYPRR